MSGLGQTAETMHLLVGVAHCLSLRGGATGEMQPQEHQYSQHSDLMAGY